MSKGDQKIASPLCPFNTFKLLFLFSLISLKTEIHWGTETMHSGDYYIAIAMAIAIAIA